MVRRVSGGREIAHRFEERVARLEEAYPDGNYPAPRHPPGACAVCDALRALWEKNARP